MTVVPENRVAFRCKNCGRLHEAGHAGELPHPAACQVCGCGVVFRHKELAEMLEQSLQEGDTNTCKSLVKQIQNCDPAAKRLLPENWEILSEVSGERLQELGLTAERVTKHTPYKAGSTDHQPKLVKADLSDMPCTAESLEKT